MERSTDYIYKNIIIKDPRGYCGTLKKIFTELGFNLEIKRSATSRSCYMILNDLNMYIRIADHDRMGYPPYKGYIKQKTWLERLLLKLHI